MYNRILKRPMFRRGGPSFQAQGTGITSPYDTPQTIGGGVIHGNPMGNRTGFQDPYIEDKKRIELLNKENIAASKAIDTETKELFETPKGQWLDDVIGSFGAYSTPYKESGEAKTIGEMGAEQAEAITAIRKERKEKQDLAALTGLEERRAQVTRNFEKASEQELTLLTNRLDKDTKLAVEKAKGNNLDIIRRIGILDQRLADGKISQKYYDDAVNSLLTKSDTLLESAKDLAQALITANMVSNEEEALEKAIVLITGLKKILYKRKKEARGGRVGYQFGTSNTGAMPIQASATETIDTPTADITETETVTEGQQASVQMPYQEFRAAIPAEVSDEIVQLIYYNQDAFADFSQITTQADVYAFNNKYGVSLVLPMDTETT